MLAALRRWLGAGPGRVRGRFNGRPPACLAVHPRPARGLRWRPPKRARKHRAAPLSVHVLPTPAPPRHRHAILSLMSLMNKTTGTKRLVVVDDGNFLLVSSVNNGVLYHFSRIFLYTFNDKSSSIKMRRS